MLESIFLFCSGMVIGASLYWIALDWKQLNKDIRELENEQLKRELKRELQWYVKKMIEEIEYD